MRSPSGHALFVLPGSITSTVNSCGCNFLCLLGFFPLDLEEQIDGGALGLPRLCLEQVDTEIKDWGQCSGADSSLLQPCPAHLLFLRPLIPVPTPFLVLDEFPVLVNPCLFLLPPVP